MTDTRLFFALWPDDRQRERLRDTLSPLVRQVEGLAVPRTNWHVTLTFVGSFPEAKVAELHAAARRIEVQPFRLRFDRFSYWRRQEIGCLDSMTVPPAAEALVTALNQLVIGYGVEVNDVRYRPHITAIRKARTFETMTLARPFELEFDDFELVESITLPGEVRYRPLKQ